MCYKAKLLQSHRHIFNTWWSKLLHHADIWENPRWLYSVSCSAPTCLMERRTNALHTFRPLTPDCSSYCCSHYCCRKKEEHWTLGKHTHYQVIAMSLRILLYIPTSKNASCFYNMLPLRLMSSNTQLRQLRLHQGCYFTPPVYWDKDSRRVRSWSRAWSPM